MVVLKLLKREGRISELIENPKENLKLIGLYTVVLRLADLRQKNIKNSQITAGTPGILGKGCTSAMCFAPTM